VFFIVYIRVKTVSKNTLMYRKPISAKGLILQTFVVNFRGVYSKRHKTEQIFFYVKIYCRFLNFFFSRPQKFGKISGILLIILIQILICICLSCFGFCNQLRQKLNGAASYCLSINSLKTKSRLLYLKTQSVPRCKHFSSRL
jgi:hypothetical protein